MSQLYDNTIIGWSFDQQKQPYSCKKKKKKNTPPKKNKKNRPTVSKCGQMTDFFVWCHLISAKNKNKKTKKTKKKQKKKHTFPKEFFIEIWLMIGDREYINIAEIKTGNLIFRWDLGANIFSRPAC